ncbi:MAG: phosphatase PAP2 family protein [Ignavibacteriales bacterium]|nr:phosphatase PAP2 family protein [Ignavibacteriales bacterium]
MIIIIVSQTFAQNSVQKPDTVGIGNKLLNDIELSFNNNLNFFSRPAEFNSSDWFKLAGVTVATGALMTIDKEVQIEMAKHHSNFQNDITKVGKYYGEIVPIAVSAIGVYGGGLIFGNNEMRTTGRILIESLVASGITTTILKSIIGRSRPYKNEGEFKFNFFETKTSNTSLPSGHTTVAFTISTVLAERIDNIYASIGLYGLASLTAYERIYDDRHWLSDTFLGAVIGISAGKFFSDLETESENKKSNVSFHVAPYLNLESPGVSVLIQF